MYQHGGKGRSQLIGAGLLFMAGIALFASIAQPQAATSRPGDRLPSRPRFVPEPKVPDVAGVRAITVASSLTNPVFVAAPPGDYNRLFIVQLNGQIKILNLATGVVNAAPFLSITVGSSGEQGLLGLAFDPDYSDNTKPGYGKFYLDYVAAVGSGVTHIEQRQVSANPDVADTTPSTIKTLLTVTQPQNNHNGGWIGFSPRANDDHNLYIALGDGGNGDDTGTGHAAGGNAQSTSTLLGKMLRIHVDPAAGTYTIPSNNPYALSSPPVQKEIWLLGLRNPYRDSFDRLTGRMYIGDVGQNTREEVDVQQPTNPGGGENYGWRDREGFIQNPTYATVTPTATPSPPWIDPIIDYPRTLAGPTPCNNLTAFAGRTIIGGNVYRGKQIPSLAGTYVFGDYLGQSGCGTRIFALNYNGTTASNFQDITTLLFPTADNTPVSMSNPTGFGEDANGELYIADIGAGRVYRIVPSTPNVQVDKVTRLGNGHSLVQGTGLPFKTHTVQAVSEANQPFVTPGSNIGTVVASGDGTFQFEDVNASSFTRRFYRVLYP